jgi:hypothetical protein
VVLIDEIFDFKAKGVKFGFALNPEAEGALSILQESTRKKGYLVSYVRVKFFAHVIISNLPSFFLGCLRLRGLLSSALRLGGSGHDCV